MIEGAVRLVDADGVRIARAGFAVVRNVDAERVVAAAEPGNGETRSRIDDRDVRLATEPRLVEQGACEAEPATLPAVALDDVVVAVGPTEDVDRLTHRDRRRTVLVLDGESEVAVLVGRRDGYRLVQVARIDDP